MSRVFDPLVAARYLDALKKEIRSISSDAVFSTLYIGGGTPTVLSAEALTGMIDFIFCELAFSKHYEATIEANPGTVDTDKLEAMFGAGINRISFGVQSMHRDELVFLGRAHTADDADAAVNSARASGFDNIGIDLIYGIPGQTLASWKTTLSNTVKLRPQHISTYELTAEEGTELHAIMKSRTVPGGNNNAGSPRHDEETIIEMYGYALEFLTSHGFVHYEISNFALHGLLCRHNLNYWIRGNYVGVGAGAHSLLNNVRYRNTSSIDEYIQLLSAGKSPCIDSEPVESSKALSEEFFLGLRKTCGITLDTLSRSYGIDVASLYQREIEKLTAAGLLEYDSRTSLMRLTRKGILLSNEVFSEFI